MYFVYTRHRCDFQLSYCSFVLVPPDATLQLANLSRMVGLGCIVSACCERQCWHSCFADESALFYAAASYMDLQGVPQTQLPDLISDVWFDVSVSLCGNGQPRQHYNRVSGEKYICIYIYYRHAAYVYNIRTHTSVGYIVGAP